MLFSDVKIGKMQVAGGREQNAGGGLKAVSS